SRRARDDRTHPARLPPHADGAARRARRLPGAAAAGAAGDHGRVAARPRRTHRRLRQGRLMRLRPIAVAAALASILVAIRARSQTVLPPGWVLDPPRTTQPRQMLRSEIAGGRQSTLVELGNTAFSAPSILGPAAQAIGLSCNTCHINGDANPRFFIPGMSTRPGNIDPTGPHFNPPADNGLLDPVDIPSLRGIRFPAPYGRDGRTASLREFTRNVIVGEFAGAEPSPLILDALVAYMNELEFIPTPQLAPDGALTPQASAAARRGEALFRRS